MPAPAFPDWSGGKRRRPAQMVRRYRSAAGTRPNSIQLRGAPPRQRALGMHRRGFLQTLGFGSLAATAFSRTTASAASVVKPRRLTAGRHSRADQPGDGDLPVARRADRQGIAGGARPQGTRRRASARSSRVSGRRGQGARRRHQRAVRGSRRWRQSTRFAVAGEAAGSCRYLDFDVIRRNPKILLGYSDITALLLVDSRQDRPGDVPRAHRHGPLGPVLGRLLPARAVQRRARDLRRTSTSLSDRNSLTQIEFRTQTIVPGKAHGRLLGGNLTVLTWILGSPVPAGHGTARFCSARTSTRSRIESIAWSPS